MDATETRKRPYNDGQDGGHPMKRRGQEPLLKLLIPSLHVGHVLGKGGSYVNELRSTYKGHIAFSPAQPLYPGTEDRVCLLTGTVQQITDLSYQILNRLMSKHEDNVTKIIVTPLGAGMIIGKGGATIKQIKEQCGVKMGIADSFGPMVRGERTASIFGTLDQRFEAVKKIIDIIAEEPSNMANNVLKYGPDADMQGGANLVGSNKMTGPNNSRNMGDPGYGMGGASNNNYNNQPPPAAPSIAANFNQQQQQQQLIAALMKNLTQGMAGPQQQPPGVNPGKHRRMNVLSYEIDMKLDVPNNMVGFIMGKKGQGVRDLFKQSNGAKFFFENSDAPRFDFEGTRKLTVSGTIEQINQAFDLIHDKVDEFTRLQLYQQRRNPNTDLQPVDSIL